jgi:hypothetical protein
VKIISYNIRKWKTYLTETKHMDYKITMKTIGTCQTDDQMEYNENISIINPTSICDKALFKNRTEV